jgi:2-polyprenyl-6-methoxyphenol hydroxylase-like FAD-dependent oxidoreductase
VTIPLDSLPIAVIGAGPVGLAAGAHLAARGLPFLVLEAGLGPAATVRAWGHVRLFSPWRYNVDPAAAKLLADAGWVRPDDDRLPTGAELADEYLRPLADLPALARTSATAPGSPGSPGSASTGSAAPAAPTPRS